MATLPLVAMRLCVAVVVLVVVSGPVRAATAIAVTTDRADALYTAGSAARFAIDVTSGGEPVHEGRVAVRVTRDGGEPLQVFERELAGGTVVVEQGLAEPGFVRVEVTLAGFEPEVKGLGAAAFSPERIEPAEEAPADFDVFWEAQKAALAHVPLDVRLEDRPDQSNEQGVVQKVSLAGIGGSRVRGWLAVPRTEGPHPALLVVPWAGVYASPRFLLGPVGRGYVVLSISAHDLDIDLPEERYRELGERGGPLEGYMFQGRESRENYYYRRVYLSTVRAVDYLVSRPDWNGRTLVVTGASQGGGLSLVAAGLDPRITALAATVPALCDFQGYRLNRQAGWPQPVWGGNPVFAETVRYYDAVHFARRTEVPALVGVGFIDTVCSPSSVYAAYGVLRGPKRMVTGPLRGHDGPEGWGVAFEAFLDEQAAR